MRDGEEKIGRGTGLRRRIVSQNMQEKPTILTVKRGHAWEHGVAVRGAMVFSTLRIASFLLSSLLSP
jgi:hypothetical protein